MTYKPRVISQNVSDDLLRQSNEGMDGENDDIYGGLVCPRCNMASMQYNGLLELTCPNCGYRAPGAAFT